MILTLCFFQWHLCLLPKWRISGKRPWTSCSRPSCKLGSGHLRWSVSRRIQYQPLCVKVFPLSLMSHSNTQTHTHTPYHFCLTLYWNLFLSLMIFVSLLNCNPLAVERFIALSLTKCPVFRRQITKKKVWKPDALRFTEKYYTYIILVLGTTHILCLQSMK